MSAVSNRIVAGLLLLAIVVSVVGTFVSVGRISSLRIPLLSITGFVAGSGITNVTIDSAVGVTVSDSVINFGNGYYSSACTSGFAVLNGTLMNSTCWRNTTATASNNWDASHVIENTGTTNFELNASTSNPSSAEGWLCSNSNCPLTTTAALFLYSSNNESNSCGGTLFAPQLLNDTATMNGNNTRLCSNMNYQDNQNSLNLTASIIVPKDASPGGKILTVTYTATAT